MNVIILHTHFCIDIIIDMICVLTLNSSAGTIDEEDFYYKKTYQKNT